MTDKYLFFSLYKDALLKIKHLVSDRDNELSGCIYPDGNFLIKEGNKESALVLADSDFIWHSHPDGKLFFSLNDWLCIFYSNAKYIALFAGNKILVVKKTAVHEKLYLEFHKIASQFHGYNSVIYYKFIQILEIYFNIDVSTDIDETLLFKFNLEYAIYKEESNSLININI